MLHKKSSANTKSNDDFVLLYQRWKRRMRYNFLIALDVFTIGLPRSVSPQSGILFTILSSYKKNWHLSFFPNHAFFFFFVTRIYISFRYYQIFLSRMKVLFATKWQTYLISV